MRIILTGQNHSFPSAVHRFGVAATYSGTAPECQPGRSGEGQSTHEVNHPHYSALEAAGKPSRTPAADMGGCAALDKCT